MIELPWCRGAQRQMPGPVSSTAGIGFGRLKRTVERTSRARSRAASSRRSERLLRSRLAAWSISSRCSGKARRRTTQVRMMVCFSFSASQGGYMFDSF
ncbi:MAG: hypothetical protein QM772_00165 [Ottowia sp.]